jgi:hypothetical protein
MKPGYDIMPIDDVTVPVRYRRDLGDLTALAHSMATIGLLHVIVVTPDGVLVAGARRLAAAKLLGWSEIRVHVVDLDDVLLAQHDENEVRLDFTVTERIAIGRAIEAQIAAKNAAKRATGLSEDGTAGGRGRTKQDGVNLVGTLAQGLTDKTRDQVGKAIGWSGSTYAHAKAVVEAAETDPAHFGHLPAQMDAEEQVNPAYRALQDARNGASVEQSPMMEARRVEDEFRLLRQIWRHVLPATQRQFLGWVRTQPIVVPDVFSAPTTLEHQATIAALFAQETDACKTNSKTSSC